MVQEIGQRQTINQPLSNIENYDYTLDGRALTGQDRAFLLLGRALEQIDPNELASASSSRSYQDAPILQDPRRPDESPITIGEFSARLESEFGLSPNDWPGQNTPYTARRNNGQYNFDNINAILQSLGDHLAADADTIPFNFVRPDSYLVLGDESASDIAFRYNVDAGAIENNVLGSGSVIDLSSDSLTSAPLTTEERNEQTIETFTDLTQRLSSFRGFIDANPRDVFSSESSFDGPFSTPEGEPRSWVDFLDNSLNPQLEQLTGNTLQELILPYGLASLYDTSAPGSRTTPSFTLESRDNLLTAIGQYTSANFPEQSRQATISELGSFKSRIDQLSTHPLFNPNHIDYVGENGALPADTLQDDLSEYLRTPQGDPARNPAVDQYFNEVSDFLTARTGQNLTDLLSDRGVSFYTQNGTPNLTQDNLKSISNAVQARIFDTQLPGERDNTILLELADVTSRLQTLRNEGALDNGGSVDADYRTSIFADVNGEARTFSEYITADVDPRLIASTGRTFFEIAEEDNNGIPSSYNRDRIDTILNSITTFSSQKNFDPALSVENPRALATLSNTSRQFGDPLNQLSTGINQLIDEQTDNGYQQVARTTERLIDTANESTSLITNATSNISTRLSALQSATETELNTLISDSSSLIDDIRSEAANLSRIDSRVSAYDLTSQFNGSLVALTKSLNAFRDNGNIASIAATTEAFDRAVNLSDSIPTEGLDNATRTELESFHTQIQQLAGSYKNLEESISNGGENQGLLLTIGSVSAGSLAITIEQRFISNINSIISDLQATVTSGSTLDNAGTESLTGGVINNGLHLLNDGERQAVNTTATDVSNALERHLNAASSAERQTTLGPLRDTLRSFEATLNPPGNSLGHALLQTKLGTVTGNALQTANSLIAASSSPTTSPEFSALRDELTVLLAYPQLPQNISTLTRQLDEAEETINSISNADDFITFQGSTTNFNPEALTTLGNEINGSLKQLGISAGTSSANSPEGLSDHFTSITALPRIGPAIFDAVTSTSSAYINELSNTDNTISDIPAASTRLQNALQASSSNITSALQSLQTIEQNTDNNDLSALAANAAAGLSSLHDTETRARDALLPLYTQLQQQTTRNENELISPNTQQSSLDGLVNGDIAGEYPTFSEYFQSVAANVQAGSGQDLTALLAERGITVDSDTDLSINQLQEIVTALGDITTEYRQDLITQRTTPTITTERTTTESTNINGSETVPPRATTSEARTPSGTIAAETTTTPTRRTTSSETNNPPTRVSSASEEYVPAAPGNISTNGRGEFYVNGELRSYIKIAAEIRFGSIDIEATKSANLIQKLNARAEKSALGSDILAELEKLRTSPNDNFPTQASIWTPGSAPDAIPPTGFANALRQLSEDYNVDDVFAEFLPDYQAADPTIYSNEDLEALKNAIEAFLETASRDDEREQLEIQESHSTLNVLYQNLSALINFLSQQVQIIQNY